MCLIGAVRARPRVPWHLSSLALGLNAPERVETNGALEPRQLGRVTENRGSRDLLKVCKLMTFKHRTSRHLNFEYRAEICHSEESTSCLHNVRLHVQASLSTLYTGLYRNLHLPLR
jgi:hypothetical protein